MVDLEQIKKLEQRVDKAVQLISVLREENQTLRSTLENSQGKISELEKLIARFFSEKLYLQDL